MRGASIRGLNIVLLILNVVLAVRGAATGTGAGAFRSLAAPAIASAADLSPSALAALLNTSNITDIFPYHRCSDYSNSSLPYHLSAPTTTVQKAGGALYCMNFTYSGPVGNASACYQQLSTAATWMAFGVSEFGTISRLLYSNKITLIYLVQTPSAPPISIPTQVFSSMDSKRHTATVGSTIRQGVS